MNPLIASSRALPYLPVELLATILQFASPRHLPNLEYVDDVIHEQQAEEYLKQRADFATLSLVSKAWYEAIKVPLYREVVMFGCLRAYLGPLSVTLQKYGDFVRTIIFDSRIIELRGRSSLLGYSRAKKHRRLERCLAACRKLHQLEAYGSNQITFEIFEASRAKPSNIFPVVPIRTLKWFPGQMTWLSAPFRQAAPHLESLSIVDWSSRSKHDSAELPLGLPKLRIMELVRGSLDDMELLHLLLAIDFVSENGTSTSSLLSLTLEEQSGVSPAGIETALKRSGAGKSLRTLNVTFHAMQRDGPLRKPPNHFHDFPSKIFDSCPNLRSFVLLSPTTLNSFSTLPQQLQTLTLTIAGDILLQDLAPFVERYVQRGVEMTIRITRRCFDPTWAVKLSRFEGNGSLLLSPYDEPRSWAGPFWK